MDYRAVHYESAGLTVGLRRCETTRSNDLRAITNSYFMGRMIASISIASRLARLTSPDSPSECFLNPTVRDNFGTFKRAEISLIFRVSDTRQSN